MRMAFGLVSLLVGVVLMCLFFYNLEAPELEAGHQAQVQVQQMAGRDGNGVPVDQTYVMQAEPRPDGKLKDLLVTHINLGSPMDAFFGLQEKDKIIAAIGQGGYQTDFGGSDDVERREACGEGCLSVAGKIDRDARRSESDAAGTGARGGGAYATAAATATTASGGERCGGACGE